MRVAIQIGWLAVGLAFGGGCSSDDAAPASDASLALAGIGKRCGVGHDPCPTGAPLCHLEADAFVGYCTANCLESATATTDAQSKLGNIMPPPSTGDATCAALLDSAVAPTKCSNAYDLMPAVLQPNTDYTLKASCTIRCSAAQRCPGDLACEGERCIVPR